MEENVKLSKWTEEYQQIFSPCCQEYIKKYPCREVVGSLLYLAFWSRPDITFTVHTVAKHSNHPTLEAVYACNRILNYIGHTQHLGLTFCPGHIRLTSFVDSSFADVIENCKSTSGLIQYIGTSPVYWDSFVVNTTVPLSTAESEYVAVHVACEIIAINNLIVELNYPQQNVPLFEDNKA